METQNTSVEPSHGTRSSARTEQRISNPSTAAQTPNTSPGNRDGVTESRPINDGPARAVVKLQPSRGRPGGGRTEIVYAPETIDAVAAMYANGMSMRVIAAALSTHYREVRRIMLRYGLRVRPRHGRRGEANPNWRGRKIGYSGIHARLVRQRGQPKHCEKCGTTDPSKGYEWANVNGDYTDIANFIRLCQSCHRKMDGNGRRREVSHGH